MLFYLFRGDLLHQNWVVFGFFCYEAYVAGVAFVSRSCMGNFHELNFHIFTTGFTKLFGIRAGQYAMTSSTFGRPAPKPVTEGGPLKTRGAISLVKRSTAARFCERTPKRITTSGNWAANSGEGSAAAIAWQALTPSNSLWIASKSRPIRFILSRRMRAPAFAFLYASGQA